MKQPPVIVLRPEPGCAATCVAAAALGFDARAFALFAVRPHDWVVPAPENIDALLIGSANAVRHAGAALTRFVGKPVYAVGATTAEVVRDAGLSLAHHGTLGLQDLLATLHRDHRRLLRLSGRERVALTLPEGVTMCERIVYASERLPFPNALIGLLQDHPHSLVLLHSAQAAQHFSVECDQNGLDRGALRLAALAPRIAQAAGDGWAICEAAATPDDSALLTLAQKIYEQAGPLVSSIGSINKSVRTNGDDDKSV